MTSTVGVDIASFQGSPHWPQAYAAGYRFAYVKSSQYPHYVNPFYEKQRHDAFHAGMIVGTYCYGVGSLGRGKEQAVYFLESSTFHDWHLAPFLDLEEAGSEGASPKALEQFAYDWGTLVCANLGIKHVLLYTDLNMLRNRVYQSKRLRDLFLLDLAYWTLGPPPKVPGWRMVMHQYDTSRGVPGFSGPVDRDRALVPLQTLTIAALRTESPPKHTPSPKTHLWQRPRFWLPHL